MALERQITNDGWRNAAVKLAGVLGPEDVVTDWEPAVALGHFTNNDARLTFTGLRIDKVTYSIGDGIEILLEWNSNSPQMITPIAGRGKISARSTGGFNPDTTRSGFDGAINLHATAAAATGTIQNFTVELEMVKLYV